MPSFQYGTDKLTASLALDIANGKVHGKIGPEAVTRILQSESHVRAIVNSDTTVYGINTGFGILANTAISKEDTATLQYKILQSHSVGVGDPIPAEIARLMLITRSLFCRFFAVSFSTEPFFRLLR